jgi:hypothetical protein
MDNALSPRALGFLGDALRRLSRSTARIGQVCEGLALTSLGQGLLRTCVARSPQLRLVTLRSLASSFTQHAALTPITNRMFLSRGFYGKFRMLVSGVRNSHGAP